MPGIYTMSGETVVVYETNDILAELAAALETLVSNDEGALREVYDYRTTPQETTSASISSMGGLPVTTEWTDIHQDFIIDVGTPHKGTPATLRAAEFRINDLEMQIWKTLLSYETSVWHKLEPARKSMKPSAPPENKYMRRCLIFVRVIPN